MLFQKVIPNIKPHSKTGGFRYKTGEDVEQPFDIHKDGEDFKTTGMHSRESMEATFFLSHLGTLLVCKLYERLKGQKSLDKYAASKVCDAL